MVIKKSFVTTREGLATRRPRPVRPPGGALSLSRNSASARGLSTVSMATLLQVRDGVLDPGGVWGRRANPSLGVLCTSGTCRQNRGAKMESKDLA